MNLLEALQNDREKADLFKAINERQQRETDAVNKACLTELTKEIPGNIYYQGQLIRYFLSNFYKSDKDSDGRLSIEEFMESTRPKQENFQGASEEEIKEAFQQYEQGCQWFRFALDKYDINHDRRLTLGEFLILGFFQLSREDGFSVSRKVD